MPISNTRHERTQEEEAVADNVENEKIPNKSQRRLKFSRLNDLSTDLKRCLLRPRGVVGRDLKWQ